MKRTQWMGIAVAGAGAFSVIMMAMPAMAQKPFLAAVAEHFHLPKESTKCTLCHGAGKGPSKTNLNDFGKAIQADPDMKPVLGKKAGDLTADDLATVSKVIEKISDKDSDGDGATNGEELALGTLPGDAKSTPSKADLEKYRKDHPAKK